MKRWRHFTVAVGIMPALAIYVGVMVWLSTFIIEVHFLLDLLFFTVAGLAWIPAASAVVKCWRSMKQNDRPLQAALETASELMRAHGLHDWTVKFDHARRRAVNATIPVAPSRCRATMSGMPSPIISATPTFTRSRMPLSGRAMAMTLSGGARRARSDAPPRGATR